ncbi:MAG: hypothetical protein WC971_07095 [Coriobacteriia bacterium]
MALQDILDRIGADAAAEAGAVLDGARAEAEALVSTARASAEAERARIVGAAETAAARDAGRTVAAARLASRDATLVAKRELAESVLDAARERVLALDAAAYAAWIAARVAAVSRGGESVRVGASESAKVRAALPAAFAAAGAEVTLDAAAADTDRGVVVLSAGVRAEISPEAALADAREESLLAAARILFDETGGGA